MVSLTVSAIVSASPTASVRVAVGLGVTDVIGAHALARMRATMSSLTELP
jgi:hypothetical protein